MRAQSNGRTRCLLSGQPTVQQHQVFSTRVAGADVVQQFNEAFVVLAVDGFQLYRHIVRLCQCLAAKEVGCGVVGPQHRFVLGCHHGCELSEVANHQ